MKTHNYILSEKIKKTCSYGCRVAVVINLYYYNDMDRYYKYIKAIPNSVDVYLFSADERVLEKASENIVERRIICCMKENRGRDLSALLVGFGKQISKYDMLCFVHDKAKKFEHMEPDIDKWIENLWGNMLETEEYICNVIELLESSNLGILIPPEPVGEYLDSWYRDVWYDNLNSTMELAKKLGIELHPDGEDRLSLGSVFWCRTDALKKIFNYPWKYEDFPDEPMANDGTISHAIERLFGYAALDAGYEMGVVMNEAYAAWLLELAQDKLKNTYHWIWSDFGIKNTYELDRLLDEKVIVNKFFDKNAKVYIYGAGDFAQSYIKRLRYFGNEPIGFVVSDGHRKENELLGYPVYEISEVSLNSNIGIIIASSYGLQLRIKNTLDELGFKNYIFANFK